MRKPLIFIVMMFVLVIAVGCSQPPAAEPAIAAAKVKPTRFAPARIAASVAGSLAPRAFVELSVTSAGVVSDVLAAEGDQVQAGQVLVRLNDTPFKLAVAEANLKLSQAKLNLTRVQKTADSTDPGAAQPAVSADQVKDAQLAVELAQLTLEQAQANRDGALVRAPMAGMVAEVQLKVGQWVALGTPSITLADTGGWVVDTSLTDSSVVDLQQGQRAKVKFNAIPGLEMTGHIESISLRAQDQQGELIYIARVALDGSDPRLRWGMGTLVQFEK